MKLLVNIMVEAINLLVVFSTESHEVIENLLNDLKNLCKEYSEKEK